MDSFRHGTASLIPKEAPFSQIPFEEKLEAAKDIAKAAVPNILTSIAMALKDFISLTFIGRLNNALLFAALGFSITWTNAFGTALLFGLAAGFGTVASQAYGAGNYYKLGLLYQKSLVVASIILCFVTIILWFTEAVLLASGFEADLAAEIGLFIRCLILDIFLCMIAEMTRFYLVVQNIFYAPAWILACTTTLHIFWCYIFVNVLELELVGVAIARTITDGTTATLMYLYAHIKNPSPQSWFPWTKECLVGLFEYGKEILAQGSSIYIEWIAFESTTIIIGYLGDVTVLAGHAATLNYFFTNSTISLGLIIGMSIFIGNAAGEGSVKKAQKYAYVGAIVNLIVVTIADIILFFVKEKLAHAYTNEPEVNEIMISIFTIYCFGMHGDLCCNCFAYILRTLGQEKFVLKGFVLCYYGIGVAFSLITSIGLGWSYVGVWGSIITGCYVMLIVNFFRFRKLDWEKEVRTIAKEMKRESIDSKKFEDFELM